jgi:hypothetical protein
LTVPRVFFPRQDSSLCLIGNPPRLDITGKLTVSALIMPLATNGIRNIVARGYTLSPPGEISLRICDGAYQFGTWNGTGHAVSAPVPRTDIGRWIHIIGVYDGHTWLLYHQGGLLAQQADTVGALPVASNWAIGNAGGKDMSRGFGGFISEVSIWNGPADISRRWKITNGMLTGTEPGLVGYWPLSPDTVSNLTVWNMAASVAERRTDKPITMFGQDLGVYSTAGDATLVHTDWRPAEIA